MKVLTWNLNHRVREKSIASDLGELFSALSVDVVLLNEFVDGPTRVPFRQSLREAGYQHQLVSFTPARHNQVFAASRVPFSHGDIAPPTFDGSAVSNFLHIRFDDAEIELVGLRVPAYETGAERRAYWDELLEIMDRASSRSIAFAGDFNRNPFAKLPPGEISAAAFPGAVGYSVPNPVGGWSYVNYDGSKTSRIDHVAHTGSLSIGEPKYVDSFNHWVLAGPKTESPISDHAALMFTVSR